MESIRKLSNFIFQWTSTLYKNNLKHIALYFTVFKGYRRNNQLYKITPKKILMGARENNFQKL